jgi:hypothetical protein
LHNLLQIHREGGLKIVSLKPVIEFYPIRFKKLLILRGRRTNAMKTIVATILVLAIAVGLVVGVIVPIANHGRVTAATSKAQMSDVDTSIGDLSVPIN